MSDECIGSACSMANCLTPNDTQAVSKKRYKDQFCVNLKTCHIDYTKLEALAADRSQWRRAVEHFEQQCIDTAKTHRATRKARTFTNSSTFNLLHM